MNQEPENLVMKYTPQWQEKLGYKLFPANYVEFPELPDMKDVFVCRTTIHFSWIDIIRLIVSGKLEVESKTSTENVIGKHLTNERVSVRPPSWLDRK